MSQSAITGVAIDAAITTIERSRASHVSWIDHPADCAECKREVQEKGPAFIAGGPDFHRECIAGYDQVLDVLRRMRQEISATTPVLDMPRGTT